MASQTDIDDNQNVNRVGRPCLVTLTAIVLTFVGFAIEVLAIPGILGILNRSSQGVYRDTPDTIVTIILMLGVGILAFAGGIGLLRMKSWGRILALVFIIYYFIAEIIGIFACTCFPMIQKVYKPLDLILLFARLAAEIIIIRWYIVNRKRFT